MSAIYKRELKAYFSSPLGYVVIAFLVFIVSFYFYSFNLIEQYPWFGMGLYKTSFILILIAPIITMRIMAEERRQKTDQLLYTAPVNIFDIVFGKYLSVLTVFAIPMLFFCIYPIILLKLGKSADSLAMDYVGILGYFMMGAACIAIGFFVSTVTESQVLAAVLTFAILLISYLSNTIASLIPATADASLLGLSVLIVILGIVIFFMTRNLILSALISFVLECGVFVIFALKSTMLEGVINNFLSALDLTQRLTNLVYGDLDLTVIAYYISVIALFLFLSVQSVYKRRWS